MCVNKFINTFYAKDNIRFGQKIPSQNWHSCNIWLDGLQSVYSPMFFGRNPEQMSQFSLLFRRLYLSLAILQERKIQLCPKKNT